MEYLYETPKPTKELVIVLMTALISVTIIGTFFYQISMDGMDDKYNADSLVLLRQQFNEKEIALKYKYTSKVKQLKMHISVLQLQLQSHKIMLDSCRALLK